MTGSLGLKREEAAATADFSVSCSSEKPEARGRGLWAALPSRSPAAVRVEMKGGGENADH